MSETAETTMARNSSISVKNGKVERTSYKRGTQPRCQSHYKINGQSRVCNHPVSFHGSEGDKDRHCKALGCHCRKLST